MVSYSIRFEDDAFLKFKIISKKEQRSMNKQIKFIIDKFIEDYEKANGEIKVNTDDLYE